MDDRFNTIAGWTLGAGIVLLGATLVTGEIFKAERPEHMGYPINGVVEEGEGGAAAEQPIAHYLQTADATRGQAIFGKCQACHTINQGGAAGLGPNLYGVMGAGVARHAPGFNYSEPLRAHGGTWDWETMSQWLRSPRTFAAGTRMTFAGLSDPQDRADILLYLNQNGGNLQVPPPPAAGAAEGNAAAPAGNGAAPASNGAAEATNAAAAQANQIATNNKQ
ncbi:c-type cytochrome [Sphingosinicella sp.]|uniref:c-type cytochrome n=1 Tax=Sphingosinicella sp. TaxID=1917971 RepID=UPI0040382FAC